MALALLLSSCSGAQVSTDHHGEEFGRAPPVPRSGGVGPVEVAVEPPVDDFTVPARLPGLLQVYHAKLVERAHMLPEGQAKALADAEIAALRREFDGRDEDLAQELRHRLQPGNGTPGDLETTVQQGPVFPLDPIGVTLSSNPGGDK